MLFSNLLSPLISLILQFPLLFLPQPQSFNMQPILVLDFLILPLSNKSPDMSLDFDDGPHLLSVHPSNQVPSGPCLKSHNMTSKMSEPVGKYPRPDQSLKTHVPDLHPLVPLSLSIPSPVLLYHYCSCSHPQKSSSVDPSSNVSLEDQDLSGQNSVSFLFQVEIVCVF